MSKPIIDAVAVAAKDLNKTLDFYRIFEFEFAAFSETHYEAVMPNGLRFMVDTEEFLVNWGRPAAVPASFSMFALKFETAKELDETVEKIRAFGCEVEMEPQDTEWGQRYAIVKDPNGNKVDLFVDL